MNLQRVVFTTLSLIVIALVIIIVLQYKKIEKFMDTQIETNLSGDTINTLNSIDAAQCEKECKTNPACRAAVITKDNTCLLKSTIGTPIQDLSASSLRFVCELYNKKDFHGKIIGIDVGRYTLSDLEKLGYDDKSLMSIRIKDGYKLTVYDGKGFNGSYMSFTRSQPNLKASVRIKKSKKLDWSNAVSSIIVEKL